MRDTRHMRRALRSFLVLAALGLLLPGCDQFAQYAKQADGKPTLQLGDTLHDFGQVAYGAIVEHTYHVVNVGSGTLQLTLNPLECDCLTVRPWKLILAPGEHEAIRVAFNTKGFYGHEFKRVAFATNTARGYICLYLQAEILQQQ